MIIRIREREREIGYSAGVAMEKEADLEKEVWIGVLLDKAEYLNK